MPIPNLFYGYQDALLRGASPTTLAVGDSWFWYPFDNLLGEIATGRLLQSIVVAGYLPAMQRLLPVMAVALTRAGRIAGIRRRGARQRL